MTIRRRTAPSLLVTLLLIALPGALQARADSTSPEPWPSTGYLQGRWATIGAGFHVDEISRQHHRQGTLGQRFFAMIEEEFRFRSTPFSIPFEWSYFGYVEGDNRETKHAFNFCISGKLRLASPRWNAFLQAGTGLSTMWYFVLPAGGGVEHLLSPSTAMSVHVRRMNLVDAGATFFVLRLSLRN